jgi:glycosyltransferase involved in cell wall biosynthesis
LQNNSAIKFIIGGDGNDKEELVNRLSVRKLNNVNYVGYISNISWFCSLLDCLVVPSHHEPMGMIVVEAQAMRIPVIASNVDGLNEVAIDGENALLFKPKDIVDLESTITKLVADKALQEKLKIAGVQNAKKYSIENYIMSLSDIYSKIT